MSHIGMNLQFNIPNRDKLVSCLDGIMRRHDIKKALGDLKTNEEIIPKIRKDNNLINSLRIKNKVFIFYYIILVNQ
jgi:hypothetical protein